jgi:RNA polymerase sigma-70 factor (ECF subfamily)
MTENEIIRLILHGDKDKFRVLVEQHQQMVFRTCLGFVHNKDDADDLTQEVFILAWHALEGFKGDSAFSTWIYRIAVNASLNKVRKSSKKFILQRLDSISGNGKSGDMPIPVSVTENPENILIRDEQVKWVQNAIDTLPENQRIAIVLSKYDDLSQKEIAGIMNITEGAVEALIHRAKKNLHEKLSTGRKKNKN